MRLGSLVATALLSWIFAITGPAQLSIWGQSPATEEFPVPSVPTVHSTAAPTGLPLYPTWNDRLEFHSADEAFRLHVGGNAQWDSVWLMGSQEVLGAPSSNATSTLNAGASLLRRARIKLDGRMHAALEYSLEFDLANAVNENKGIQAPTQDNVAGSPFPCNVWMQLLDVPWFQNIRIGNQVKPIGMTNNTYQGFLPFLERAENMDAFYGPFDEGFDPGIAALGWREDESVAWRYGLYRPLKNSFSVGIENYTVSGRITALPIDSADGRRLVHVGLSGAQGSVVDDAFRLRVRPLLRNGPGYAVPVVADTGTWTGNDQFLLGPEFAMVFGSWTIQAEWTGQFFTDVIDAGGQPQGTAMFHGGYFQILYFLTGEHQAYERKEGVFGRVVPLQNARFGRAECGGGGCGAWQVGARLSYIDLDDNAIRGGQVTDLTLGLNWFLNPNMKIQTNCLIADRQGQMDQGDGWYSGLGIRAACDF